MKKAVCILSLALCACLSAAPALAAEGGVYANAYELSQAWMSGRTDYESSPYPDYICGVWSTDGSSENLTFAVTDDAAGEAGKKEILALVIDDSTVSFVYQEHTYAELLAVQRELEPYFAEDVGLMAVAVDERNNRVELSVNSAHEGSQEFMELCRETYGGLVYFDARDGLMNEFAVGLEPAVNQELAIRPPDQSWYTWLLWAALLLGCGFLWAVRTHRVPVRQTSGGGTAAGAVSRRRMAELIRDSAVTPDDGTLPAILEQLEQDRKD